MSSKEKSREYMRRRRMEDPDFAARQREAAAKWQGSDAGRAWKRRRYREENGNEYQRARTAAINSDPEARERMLEAERQYRRAAYRDNPEFKRRNQDYNMRRKYGITLVLRDRMLRAQCGLCALCRAPVDFADADKRKAAVVDHCHLTDRVRGILCGGCNLSLGAFGDDPNRLRHAAEYLER